jgi:hypothetical protein
MAMHYWNGSSWAIVNNSNTGDLTYEDAGAVFRIWNGSEWLYTTNAKVYNGSTWKGFVDQVQLSNDGASNVTYGGGAEAYWAIYSSGSVIYSQDNSYWDYPWIVNPANSNQYEIYVDFQSGEPLENTSDPLNQWLDLGTTRVWRVFANEFNSSAFAILNTEIRHKITQVTVATNQFTLYATTTGIPIPQ